MVSLSSSPSSDSIRSARPEKRQALHGYIRDGFKRSKKLGNVEKVKRKWIEAEQLLQQLEGCSTSMSHLERTRKLARHLVSRSSLPIHPPPASPSALTSSPRTRTRRRERPSILHATQFSPPMLRIRPQPIGTSMMIFNRRRKSQKRFDQLVIARAYVEMMREEERFERRTKGGNEGGRKWGGEWIEWIKGAKEKERREQTRNNMRIPEELQARANKLNKEREQRRRLKPSQARLVKPGDIITEFDPVAEVQSDKASVEITSPFSGTIKSVTGDVGDMLKVGATLCRVELEGGEEGGAISDTPQAQSQSSTTKAPSSEGHSTSSGLKITKAFKLADIGEGITECEIVKWLVKPGDVIEEFDPIVEVTSDKASVEITSPFSGKIESLAGEVGEMLKVGSTLCEIQVVASSEEPPSLSTESPATKTAAQEEIPHPVRPDPGLDPSSSVLATPATRRFARELSIDLTRVTPTGRDGRVTNGDVLEYSKQTQGGGETKPFIPFERPPIDTSGPLPTSSSPSSSSESISLSPTRRAMFKAMTQSLQIPHFAYSETIDVTLLERLRTSLNSNIPLEYRKTLTPQDAASIERTRQWQEPTIETEDSAKFDRITLLPLLIKSLSVALHSHPLFLCTLNKSQDAEPTLTRRSTHDISLAVSFPSPSGGLFTPVLRSIENQSIFSIASQLTLLQSFVSTSGEGVPKFPPQFQGNRTITLSNIGAIGGRTTHPVIPPTGQLAIGAMGRVRVEPRFANEERARKVAKGEMSDEGGEWKIEPRLVMDVTFSADHRIVEGVELARLVETWKNVIEDPTRLLM
ncbi:uncharacterized protein JCM6883_005574 [Sporobolomyces salmoneus]|uniref:uncharacterized protein n=1 Tax=Sporobolomyces salmoneus TaxID=183962 RepID=UPI0031746E52